MSGNVIRTKDITVNETDIANALVELTDCQGRQTIF